MSASTTVRVPPEVAEVLARSRADGLKLFLPDQLDPKRYRATNKVIEALGGKWVRREGAHVFGCLAQLALDRAREATAGDAPIVDDRKLYQFYETPAEVAAQLVELAEIDGIPELRILEPSAGQGAIARVIFERMHATSHLYLIEKEEKNRGILLRWMGRTRKKDAAYEGCPENDFLLHQDPHGYDRIIANPPFANQQDVQHVQHMWELLRPGGLLVSVMSTSWLTRATKLAQGFRELLNGVREKEVVILPHGAFAASGTDVATQIVKLKKPGASLPAGVYPLFQQYYAIKREYPDVLLMFRIGDFYELFGDDAEIAARILEITLTSRMHRPGERIPMCGVPHHSVDRYVARLIAAGHRVALCEQVGELCPEGTGAGGREERQVTRVLTPGRPTETPDSPPVPVPEAAPATAVLKADQPTRNGTVHAAAGELNRTEPPQLTLEF